MLLLNEKTYLKIKDYFLEEKRKLSFDIVPSLAAKEEMDFCQLNFFFFSELLTVEREEICLRRENRNELPFTSTIERKGEEEEEERSDRGKESHRFHFILSSAVPSVCVGAVAIHPAFYLTFRALHRQPHLRLFPPPPPPHSSPAF